ncbi:MAG: UDP-N-acetylmuramate--L-alanine ligase [Lachnospiraceae bacterium]|jgi:UDP-N-acetylmuramate--alanine ligase|nr:UDP-N-acetylmuramate--L-alanine ligase [Lachnospiraceae bacterium]
MYQLDFGRPAHIHFIGIGGISMSGLALVLLDRGFAVSGSDAKASALTQLLGERGARVSIGQTAANIADDMDLVVYTAAINPENPEYRAAVEKGLPMLSRAQLLGQMMGHYRYAIAVSGTHGKTTTTSMVAHILMEAGCDPTVSVGGMLPAIGGNIRVGASQYFVTEACEYTDSFLSFLPTSEVILNIEADHLDYFRGIEQIRGSFRAFVGLLPPGALLVINGDIPQVGEIYSGANCRVVTVGLGEGNDYTAAGVTYDESACATFTAICRGEALGEVRLGVPGEHNVSNALAAIALCRELHGPDDALDQGIGCDTASPGAPCPITMETIAEGLGHFTGTDRRFQVKGEVAGVTVVDDYAHHPAEIEATLKAARRRPHRKLWCVFQPHTYSRTKALLEDFAKALSLADAVVLADIYAAREPYDPQISSHMVAERVARLGTPAHHFPNFDEIEKFLLESCTQGDLLITMGAGDIYLVGERLLGVSLSTLSTERSHRV